VKREETILLSEGEKGRGRRKRQKGAVWSFLKGWKNQRLERAAISQNRQKRKSRRDGFSFK